jgi:anti-anti-sigma regulatory factor
MDTTTCIKISDRDRPGISIELPGEFDVRDLEHLRSALKGTLGSGLPTCVNLSGVSFLDVRCTRELAIWFHLPGSRLELRNPSWQVEASFRACGLGNQIYSYLDGEHLYQPNTRQRAGRGPHHTLALAG